MNEDDKEIEPTELDNKMHARLAYAVSGAIDRMKWHEERGSTPILYTTMETSKAEHWREVFESLVGSQIVMVLEENVGTKTDDGIPIEIQDLPKLMLEVYKAGFNTGRLVEEMNVIEARENGLLVMRDSYISLPGDH